MKWTALLALVLSLSSAFASTKFGGIEFLSSVTEAQFDYLKTDLKYLYQTPNPHSDKEFLNLAKLSSGTGPVLHNWILNRVHYVVGEDFSLERNLSAGQVSVNAGRPEIIMSNASGGLFAQGKQIKYTYKLNLDGKIVPILSPRAGIIQIGEALFSPKSLLNANIKSPANSILRLGTLFHEARHSDGNKNNIAFLHTPCPANHPLRGILACDKTGNGAYAIGAMSLKHLLKNCSKCSQLDKLLLETRITESFSRVVRESNADMIKGFEGAMNTYLSLLNTNKKKLAAATSANVKASLQKEIASQEAAIHMFKQKLAELNASSNKNPILDATPEGVYKEYSLTESQQLMNNSLKQK